MGSQRVHKQNNCIVFYLTLKVLQWFLDDGPDIPKHIHEKDQQDDLYLINLVQLNFPLHVSK